MSRRDPAYDDALRSAFGRVRDVSPEQAREAAKRFEDDGKFERAEALRDYAADLESDDVDEPSSSASDTAAGDASDTRARGASDKPRSRSVGRGSSKRKRTSATRAALREAVVPDRQFAGGVRAAASTAWSVAGGMVFLVLVYLLLTKGARSVAAIRELQRMVEVAVYPPAAFPERQTNRKAAK